MDDDPRWLNGYVLFGGAELDSLPDIVAQDYVDPIAYGDLNGDGYADFLDVDENVYMGSAAPDLVPEYHWGGVPASLTRIVKDLNGDGKDELLVDDEDLAGILVYQGSDTLSNNPITILNLPTSCPDGGLSEIVGIGDINGDWHNDLAAIRSDCINGWGDSHISWLSLDRPESDSNNNWKNTTL
ncbi:MAG: hypothetical protein IPP40_14735 [bacterium]|nr:hypothetical protein [bacterium]